MTRHSSLAQARHTLLSSLGLPPDASAEELAAKKAELSSSLTTASEGRSEWLTQQIAKVDAVIALDAAGADGGADEPTGRAGDEPDAATASPAAEEADPDDPVALDEIDEVAEARRAARKAARKNTVHGADAGTSSKAAGSSTVKKTRNTSAGRRGGDTASWVARILIVAIVVAVVLAVYKLGAPADSSSDASASDLMGMGATATPTLDEAQVAELEQRVRDNPEDTDAMGQLASLYAAVGDYANASKWQARRVELMPDDVDAQLTLGVSCFNNGDLDCAKEHWDIVNELDPDRADLHFNLGYYYLSIDPPDIEMVKKEWNRVLELEPDGEYAQIVESHMGSFDTMTASPSASPTP